MTHGRCDVGPGFRVIGPRVIGRNAGPSIRQTESLYRSRGSRRGNFRRLEGGPGHRRSDVGPRSVAECPGVGHRHLGDGFSTIEKHIPIGGIQVIAAPSRPDGGPGWQER